MYLQNPISIVLMLLICHFGALLHGWESIFSIFADAKCDTFVICISQPEVLISFHNVPSDPLPHTLAFY